MSRPRTIFRVGYRNLPYSQISNAMLRDKRLNMEQRGILVTILSYPPHWEFTFKWLTDAAEIGVNKARATIATLEACGYCQRQQTRNTSGRLATTVYVFTDAPEAPPSTGNRLTVDSVANEHRCTPIGATAGSITKEGRKAKGRSEEAGSCASLSEKDKNPVAVPTAEQVAARATPQPEKPVAAPSTGNRVTVECASTPTPGNRDTVKGRAGQRVRLQGVNFNLAGEGRAS